jgi:hypothetical protein
LVGLFGLVLFAVPVFAHHATQAEFDKDKKKVITGTLTKVLWINPHANWHLSVKNEKTGQLEDWTIVAAGPGAFRAAGLSQKDYFKVGETYTASIALAHNGSNRGHIITWEMPDGRKVNLWAGDGADPLNPLAAPPK